MFEIVPKFDIKSFKNKHGPLNYDLKWTWGHHNEGLPITAVRNTVERSFSKSKLIKTFYRSSLTDETTANLPMISIESSTAQNWI